jgi:hypothetical protein
VILGGPLYESLANHFWFLHPLQTCINKMVNWQDPALLLKDYCARDSMSINIAADGRLVSLVKLGHAIAGVYMCVRPFKQGIAN